ncbi:PhzF family phenazine biosynthesis protein [Nioella aestuarii]|uniref:PhzF family phenazine biosynthesis protein n=1 Tax=Nioella aestuarii TaxID=1662864 RepID=UPI003D7F7920
MSLQKLSAFTRNGQGGNPAGVLLSDALPRDDDMQRIAAEVGYSETAFAAPDGPGWRMRYFAPEGEVPFCGHATIALGAALGQAHGAAVYLLHLNDTKISVEAYEQDGVWGARLVSPPTRYALSEPDVQQEVMALFGLDADDLDPLIPIARVHGGADHLALALARDDTVVNMAYDFDTGAEFMSRHGFVTVTLFHRIAPDLIHARNAFAGHGVYEDPATGAAAAALAGYLRDAGIQSGPFRVVQGQEMGRPSELWVTPHKGQGMPIEIAGATQAISDT